MLVASGDRDTFQLASEKTTILYPIRGGGVERIREVRARYGVYRAGARCGRLNHPAGLRGHTGADRFTLRAWSTPLILTLTTPAHLFAGPLCHCRSNYLPPKSAKQV